MRVPFGIHITDLWFLHKGPMSCFNYNGGHTAPMHPPKTPLNMTINDGTDWGDGLAAAPKQFVSFIASVFAMRSTAIR